MTSTLTPASGRFTNDLLFPNHTYAGQDKDNFVLVAEGAINVPAPGLWTFAVGSDDGFRLRISGHGVEFVSEYTTGRSFDTTLATFNFPVAGIYDLRLIYYEDFGGAGVELSAAQDFQEVLFARHLPPDRGSLPVASFTPAPSGLAGGD